MPRDSLQLDQYGNLSRAVLSAIIRDIDSPGGSRRYFVGEPRGHPDFVPGVYERDGRALHLLLAFKGSATYRAAFPWAAIGIATADQQFPVRLTQALATYA